MVIFHNTAKGANLILINGILSYDNRKEVNTLRACFESNIVTLTL